MWIWRALAQFARIVLEWAERNHEWRSGLEQPLLKRIEDAGWCRGKVKA